jgi:hypothetical protein
MATIQQPSPQRSGDTRRARGHCDDGSPKSPPPNPCGGVTPPDHDCDCKTGDATRQPRAPGKPRPPKREQSCCEQLIEILSRTPGLEIPTPHKPKQKPFRKVNDLCRAFGISDALIPLIDTLWRRHEADEKPRNEFEKRVEDIFGNIAADDGKAFSEGLRRYRELRKSGKGECLFNDCLSDAADKGPIEAQWVADIVMREGLKLAGQTLFHHSEGDIGPGQVRLWDNKVFRGPNGSGATIYQGPWPWLTAIAPNHDSYEEFGNEKSFRPVPGGAHIWQNYQYANECAFTPDPTGKLIANCSRQHPPPPEPGSLIGNTCEGGWDYTRGNDCIRIPSTMPGGSIALRGFNFVTKSVRVRAVKVDDPTVQWVVECPVWGDRKTPLKDDADHFIVDERVHDWVSFPIASKHPVTPGAPLPAGLYEITVEVDNVTNVVYDSKVPPVLVTNKLLLRIEADPNVKYLFVSNSGRCNRETSGMGDDEIWWDAFVGHVVPNTVAVSATGQMGLELRPLERRSFPRGPWEDMDDGENAGAYNIDIFGPKPFELGGVAVIGLVGFEVDSEDAANQQMQGFWNAWGYALEEVVGAALGLSATATGVAELAVKAGLIAAKAALTAVLIAVAVIAVVAIIGTMLWAAWAPADLIALDIMTLDSTSAWDRTEPKKGLPPPSSRSFGDPNDSDNVVTVHERALPKDFKSGDAAAGWVQENQYDTPEDGEDASYTLVFRLARSV